MSLNMFSLVTKLHFLKSHLTRFQRYVSLSGRASTPFKGIPAASHNKRSYSVKYEEKWASGMLIQKYNSAAVDRDEVQQVRAVYADIVDDLSVPGSIISLLDVGKWFSQILQCNVPYGDMRTPFVLTMAYKMLAGPENQTQENIRLAMILGWCIEILLSSFVISDDMIDGSETRRAVPAWHMKEEVGMSAINDCFLLIGGFHAIIHKYFHEKPYYGKVMYLFDDTFLKTSIGQYLDCCISQSSSSKLELFTKEYYNNIATYKSSFISLFLPIELAMCLAGCESEIEQVKPILYDLGYFYQAENDFHDCYEDASVTGKFGSDIEEGKCTWVSMVALQKASPEQRKIMEECFGSSDTEKIAAIKTLYKELDLEREYADFKEEIMSRAQTNIEKISSERLRDLLFKICEIFKWGGCGGIKKTSDSNSGLF